MKTENKFLIPFIGLKNGTHRFDFPIEDDFFEDYQYKDFNKVNVNAVILLNKKSTLLELQVNIEGTVNVPCDITNQDFDLPIEGEIKMIVKFGEEFNDDHDEILIIPFTEHQIDVKQYIYELIILGIPQKRIHPGVLDGSLESEALDILGYYNEEEEDEDEEGEIDDQHDHEDKEEQEIDPRWAELKKLLTDK
ncbi:YceD family protein [Myroides sp. LJL115]